MPSRQNSQDLFSKYRLDQLIQRVELAMYAEVDGLPEAQLLGANPRELASHFAEKCRLDLPRLNEEGISVEQAETKVDVSQSQDRPIRDRSRPFLVPATDFKYYVPFGGDGRILLYQGNQISFNPPRATIEGQELVFSFIRHDHDAAAVKKDFERELAHLKDLLAGVVGTGEAFNASLQAKALAHINGRRERISKSTEAVAALGYPLRRRGDAGRTYAVPELKRKLVSQMPKATTPVRPLEPTLPDVEYEHILSVVSNMVAVIERSPAAFVTMREEDLRHHFLVQLNGQYEGQATGETFNFEGKTDILIRAAGKNIFIAECKFWEGPKSFSDAIDQLLGYATWHDTKMALLIFNRGRELTTVLQKIPALVTTRPDFVREVPQEGLTRFRYVLRRADDAERELTLTVLVFEVPTGEQGKQERAEDAPLSIAKR